MSKYFRTKVNVRNFPNTSTLKKFSGAFFCTVCTESDRCKLKDGNSEWRVAFEDTMSIRRTHGALNSYWRRTGLRKRGTQCSRALCCSCEKRRHRGWSFAKKNIWIVFTLFLRWESALLWSYRLWERQPVGSGNLLFGFKCRGIEKAFSYDLLRERTVIFLSF